MTAAAKPHLPPGTSSRSSTFGRGSVTARRVSICVGERVDLLGRHVAARGQLDAVEHGTGGHWSGPAERGARRRTAAARGVPAAGTAAGRARPFRSRWDLCGVAAHGSGLARIPPSDIVGYVLRGGRAVGEVDGGRLGRVPQVGVAQRAPRGGRRDRRGARGATCLDRHVEEHRQGRGRSLTQRVRAVAGSPGPEAGGGPGSGRPGPRRPHRPVPPRARP